MSTLMYERGSYGARLHLIFKRFITRLIELSRTVQRNGRPAAEVIASSARSSRSAARGN